MMQNNIKIILFLLIAFSNACSPAEEVSDIQGTRWQNCVFNAPEAMLWTSLFDNYVSKKLITAFMSCSGKKLELTPQEMVDIWPEATNIFDEATSMSVNRLAVAANSSGIAKSSAIRGRVLGRSFSATLGMFWISFDGQVSCGEKSICSFKGNGSFSDFWDFDPHKGDKRFEYYGAANSGVDGTVRVAREWMSGKPFQVTSPKVPMQFTVKDVRPSPKLRAELISFSGSKPKTARQSYTPLAVCLHKFVQSLPEDHKYSGPEVIRILSLAMAGACTTPR
jgi:hypothetical protein